MGGPSLKKYRLNLIGPFGLFHANGERIEISSKKAIALFALVAAAPNGERSRRWLQMMLWGSSAEAQAQASLRRELSTLARVLAEADAPDVLLRSSQRTALAISLLDIDTDRLSTGKMSSTPASATSDFLEGLDLQGCEEFEDWLRDERARIRELLGMRFSESLTLPPSARDILGTELPSERDLLDDVVPRMPPKPSLAVLPFSLVGDADNVWMGIGIADEIGVILSQYPQLFIVASASARALADAGVTKPEIARQLGVRYLLDGTVICLGSRVRVSASLLDGMTSEQVWAETFGGEVSDLFELQRAIGDVIAPQIWSNVDKSERRRVLRLGGAPGGDYESYWRANALFRSWRREDVQEAVDLAEQLVGRDKTCAWATSLAAYCRSVAAMFGFGDRDENIRRSVAHYQNALRFGSDNVEALGYCVGTLLNIGGDLATADLLVGHAIQLLPAHQPTLFWGGWVDVFNGNPSRARERFELALRINPASGARGQTYGGIGFACLLDNDFATALAFFAKARDADPGFFITSYGLLAAATRLGNEPEATRAMEAIGAFNASGFVLPQQLRDLLNGASR